MSNLLIKNTNIQNPHLNKLVIAWFESNAWIEVISINKRFLERSSEQKKIYNIFITIFSGKIVKEQDLTWETYCKILHNINLYDLKYRNLLRKMYSNFFSFASTRANSKKIRTYLQKYENIFLDTEVLKKSPYVVFDYLEQNICTNFPLISKPHQIKPIVCRHNYKPFIRNFFIKTENEFLMTLLNLYLENLNLETKNSFISTISYRLFFVFFEESLSEIAIDNLNIFNEETFKKQLSYFDQLLSNYKVFPVLNVSPYCILIRFYRYLDQIYYNDNGNKLFDTLSFNQNVFMSIHHHKAVDEGYEILLINDLEEVPSSNKWLVLGNGKNTHIRNKENCLLNFEVVNDNLLRNDLKEFVWRNKSKHRFSRFTHILNFLNEANEFCDKKNKIFFINPDYNEKLFSNEFLFYYYAKLSLRSDLKPASINGIITILRSYLNFFQNKYNIPSLVINQWHEVDLEESSGGNPISPKDFEVIRDTLKEKWQSEENHLLYIAFQLSMTTKLRIGEIFSLQRNCIERVDSKFGRVKYYSKSSKGKLITEVFTIDKIRLIEKAIDLSHSVFEKANESINSYIFIGTHKIIQKQVINLYTRYKKEFKKVMLELFDTLKIEEKYTPYCARDTHINNAFELVESGQISTLQVSTITGNTARIAQKHYISKKRRTRGYLEALHDVYIGENESIGIIVEDASTLKDLPPVQEGVGNCSSEKCVKIEEDEDSFYKCLTCRYFITSTERSSLFEEKIKSYKLNLENASSKAERNFYKALIELYATYLAEMYDISEGENG